MRYILKPFHDKLTTTRQRLCKAMFVLHILRKWKNSLVKTKSPKRSSISQNAWECIEINCVHLLKLTLEGCSHLITISNSQICELIFRTLRSMTSAELTQINFSMFEAIGKVKRIQFEQLLTNELKTKGIQIAEKFGENNKFINSSEILTELQCQ